MTTLSPLRLDPRVVLFVAALVPPSILGRLCALGCAAALGGCAAPPAAESEVRSYVVRLAPGQEVQSELQALCRREGLEAASIVSAVGSLSSAHLRFANRNEGTPLQGPFEVTSLSGHLGAEDFHVHAALADGEGKVVGGHVLPGNIVYTTLVVVVQEHRGWRFLRRRDPAYGYLELDPVRRGAAPAPTKAAANDPAPPSR
jgi:predicted DNA-binding protein with PD1-like motif